MLSLTAMRRRTRHVAFSERQKFAETGRWRNCPGSGVMGRRGLPESAETRAPETTYLRADILAG